MKDNVFPLHADSFTPMRFDLPPVQATAARTDYGMATIVLEWAQEARIAAARGNTAKRNELQQIFKIIGRHHQP